jgi:hypothetical protein
VVDDSSVLTPPTGPPLTMPTPTPEPLFPPLPDNGGQQEVSSGSRIPGPNLVATVTAVLAGAVETAAFPLLLLLVVILFLIIQDRIDRRDPKLALAPIRSEALTFH